jgi:hypothetical protein
VRPERRVVAPVLAVAALGLYFLFAPRLPKDQTLELVLGDASRDVTAVRVAYEDARTDWTSEVELNFEAGRAPRVVHHEAHMPDGEYVVGIDVVTAARTTHVERRVAFRGGTTAVDVSEPLRSGNARGASR